jgi:hemerythrin superfamily protein
MLTQLTHRVPVILKSLMDRKLNAPEHLIQEHLKVETLFLRMKILGKLVERFPSRKADLMKRREAVFAEIRKSLEKHTAAEEHVLYPECEAHAETRAMALEAYEEHRQVKTLLKDLAALPVDREDFEAKFTLLVEDVAHHVREEEEELFPRMRKIFSASHLMKLGSQLRGYKRHARRANVSAA